MTKTIFLIQSSVLIRVLHIEAASSFTFGETNHIDITRDGTQIGGLINISEWFICYTNLALHYDR